MAPPVSTGRFNHATINCRDAEASAEFYQRVLGFQRVRRPSFSFPGAWLYRDGLGMMLHLNEDRELPPPPSVLNTRHRHLAFAVPDMDESVATLKSHGLEVELRTLPDHGYRQAFFADPDGNIIELGEWPAAEQLAALC